MMSTRQAGFAIGLAKDELGLLASFQFLVEAVVQLGTTTWVIQKDVKHR